MGADDHVYPNFLDVMQWLAVSNLLEMIVDKLKPFVSGEAFLYSSKRQAASGFQSDLIYVVSYDFFQLESVSS